MKKDEKRKQLLKLLVMFVGVILIFFIIGKLTKEKPEDNKPQFRTESKSKKKEDKKTTNELYPILEDGGIKEINISSPELEDMVKGNLNINQIGEIEAEYDGFKNIFSKGIEVKDSLGEALALRFTPKYGKEIIANVKASDTEKEIVEKIGQPNLKHKNLMLYILDGADVVFNTELRTVTAYKNKNSDKNKYRLIIDEYEKFIKTKNIKSFITELTKQNPKYYRYKYDENSVLLDYFDLGVRIIFNQKSNTNGVYLFENFTKSENYEERIVQDLKEKNLVYIEQRRLSIVEELYVDEKEKNIIKKSAEIREILSNGINGEKIGDQKDNVEIYYEQGEGERKLKNIIIWSNDNSFPKHYLNQTAYAKSIAIIGDKIIYSIDNDGIYEVFVDGREKPKKIYEPEEREEIIFEYIDIEDRKIYFRDKVIEIK